MSEDKYAVEFTHKLMEAFEFSGMKNFTNWQKSTTIHDFIKISRILERGKKCEK